MKKLLCLLLVAGASLGFSQGVQKIDYAETSPGSGLRKILNSDYNANIAKGELRKFTNIYINSFLIKNSYYSTSLVQKPNFIDYSVNAVRYQTAFSGFGYDLYAEITLSASPDATPGNHVMKICFGFSNDPSGAPSQTDTLTINLTIYKQPLQWVLSCQPQLAEYFDCITTDGPNIIVGSNKFDGNKTNGSILLSTNNGDTWKIITNGLTAKNFKSFIIKDHNIFAGSWNGIFHSIDSGSNWNFLSNGLQGNSINSFAQIGLDIFAGSPSGGVFLLSANSESWTAVNNGLTDKRITALAVIDTNLFAGTPTGMFLSNNKGLSWVSISNGLAVESEVQCLAVIGSKIYTGMSLKGIFLSENNGASWIACSKSLAYGNVAVLATTGTNLFAGKDSDLYLSTDFGVNWKAIYNGNVTSAIVSIAVNDRYLYVVSYNNGIWRLPLSDIITPTIVAKDNYMPKEFSLRQNFPNPFNPSTTIEFSLSKPGHASLKIYSLLGEQVASLVNENRPAGIYNVNWNARELANGVYYYVLQTGNYREVRKAILMK